MELKQIFERATQIQPPGRKPQHCYLLCLDPGETTGYAIFSNEHVLTSAGEITGGLLEIWNLLNDAHPLTIVCEGFVLYAHRAAQKINSSFPEVEAIGVIRLWASLNDVEMHEQLAAAAKVPITDDILQALNVRVSSRHARDAVRHGVLFLQLYNKLRLAHATYNSLPLQNRPGRKTYRGNGQSDGRKQGVGDPDS